VLAGGRYDGLVEALGGPSTPGVGWAAGVERLAMLIEEPATASVEAVVIPMGVAAETRALGMVADLRRSGVLADMAFKGNMKRRMAKANDASATYALILGDDELAENKVVVRNLREGQQAKASLDSIGKVPLSLLWQMDTDAVFKPGESAIADLLMGHDKK
jgi:histidyl-tRNA synthetase